MITASYDSILYAAAELAGRTRDKVPPSEAVMIKGFLADALPEVWQRAVWPELTSAPEAVAPARRKFSKREGLANKMGDILGVYTADPSQTTRYQNVRFSELSNQVHVQSGLGLVWVEYQSPAPDLLGLDTAGLLAVQIPRRFRRILAFTAAGHLLRADGQQASGDEYLQLAERAVERELQRITEPVWRNHVVRYAEDGSGLGAATTTADTVSVTDQIALIDQVTGATVYVTVNNGAVTINDNPV